MGRYDVVRRIVAVAVSSMALVWSVSEICIGLESHGAVGVLTLHRSLDVSFHHVREIQATVLNTAEAAAATITVSSGLVDHQLILQCMAPQICSVAGGRYYYDPYKNVCVTQGILASVKGQKLPDFPELRAACEKGQLFADFMASQQEQQSEGSGSPASGSKAATSGIIDHNNPASSSPTTSESSVSGSSSSTTNNKTRTTTTTTLRQ